MVDTTVCVVVESEDSVIATVVAGWLPFVVSDSDGMVDAFVVVVVSEDSIAATTFHLTNSPLVVLIEPAENNA